MTGPGTRRFQLPRETGVLVALLVLCTAIALLSEYFLGSRNILNVLRGMSVVSIMALGQTLVQLVHAIQMARCTTAATVYQHWRTPAAGYVQPGRGSQRRSGVVEHQQLGGSGLPGDVGPAEHRTGGGLLAGQGGCHRSDAVHHVVVVGQAQQGGLV